MDFFYKPEIAASLAEFIGYVTPVPGAHADVLADAAAATDPDTKASIQATADSPLVFPDNATYAKLHYYRTFANPAERAAYDKIFQPIVLS
jgi:spermidine/putrescine transport system substrate-binding protein